MVGTAVGWGFVQVEGIVIVVNQIPIPIIDVRENKA
jgi:hypothetical protein